MEVKKNKIKFKIFKRIFETKKTCFNKKIQANLKMTKIYHRPTFVQYKKSHINLFSLYNMKKNQ
jgi:hypothetical protein